MQSPKIDSHVSPVIPYSTWTQKVSDWLGRLWSLCLFPWDLTRRVAQAAFACFTKPTTPIVSTKEGLEEDFDDDLLDLILPDFDLEEPPVVTDPTKGPEEAVVPLKEEKKEEPSKAADVEEKPKFAHFQRIRKPRAKPVEEKVKQVAAVAVPVASKAPSQAYQLIDNKGKGACQMYAILEGLERQYPKKIMYQENGKTKTLTHEKLRQWGVNFIRKQIDSCGPYAERILGYLDSDRKEYNASLKKRPKVQTDEAFIKLLEKPVFACSSSHLFASSILLDLPIHVHEENSSIIQIFSPKGCTGEPIHLLYQPKRMHYQYMLFSKN